jgi:hypothetical protein
VNCQTLRGALPLAFVLAARFSSPWRRLSVRIQCLISTAKTLPAKLPGALQDHDYWIDRSDCHPMHADGSLDLPGLRRLVDFHVQEGTDAIVIVGTTGESPTVNLEEHCELIRVAVEQAAGRIPVIAGTGANSTAKRSS